MEREYTLKEKLLIFTKNQKKKANKHTFIALGIVIVLMTLFLIFDKAPIPQVTKEKDTVFSASMVGDMMFGGAVEEVTKQFGFSYLFENVNPYLANSDYVTGSFENPGVLHTSPAAVQALKKANFATLNVGNNQVNTFSAFEMKNLGIVGALKDPLPGSQNKLPTDVMVNDDGQQVNLSKLASTISYTEKNGIILATLGFTDKYAKENRATTNQPGILPANLEIMLPLIKEAKSHADLVFVHMHWGEEYEMEPSPRMKDLARAVSDAGADVIIGHNTHVLSSVDVYKNTLILYGLGNFITDQVMSRTGESVLAQYQVNKNGQVKVELIPLLIREGRPQAIGTMGWFTRGKIFKELTKYTTNKQNWVVENNKLVYKFSNPLIKGGN